MEQDESFGDFGVLDFPEHCEEEIQETFEEQEEEQESKEEQGVGSIITASLWWAGYVLLVFLAYTFS